MLPVLLLLLHHFQAALSPCSCTIKQHCPCICHAAAMATALNAGSNPQRCSRLERGGQLLWLRPASSPQPNAGMAGLERGGPRSRLLLCGWPTLTAACSTSRSSSTRGFDTWPAAAIAAADCRKAPAGSALLSWCCTAARISCSSQRGPTAAAAVCGRGCRLRLQLASIHAAIAAAGASNDGVHALRIAWTAVCSSAA